MPFGGNKVKDVSSHDFVKALSAHFKKQMMYVRSTCSGRVYKLKATQSLSQALSLFSFPYDLWRHRPSLTEPLC